MNDRQAEYLPKERYGVSSVFSCPLAPAAFAGKYNELASLYAAEKDEKYFRWFLHFYEPEINKRVRKLAGGYNLPDCADDLKNAFAIGIFSAMKKFSPESDVSFTDFMEGFIQKELTEVIRTNWMGASFSNAKEAALARKTVALYREIKSGTEEEKIRSIAQKIGRTPENTKDILISALRNQPAVDIYRAFVDTDGEESLEEYIEGSVSAEDEYFSLERSRRLWEAFYALPLKEQMMISEHLGFCPVCRGDHITCTDRNGERRTAAMPRLPYTEIAMLHQYASGQDVKKVIEKAYKKLRQKLNE